MQPSSEQARLIAELKSAPSLEQYITVHLPDAGLVGFLTPITEQVAADPDVVDALFRWRREHMAAFLTVFAPTKAKTKGYLMQFSIPDPARLLFLIKDSAKRNIGHIGLCNISQASAEVDNVVRGEQVNVPNFMILASNALLAWAFSQLHVSMVYLNVLAHNTRALRTYEKVGFKEVSRTHLKREDMVDGYKLVPTENYAALLGPTLIRMELDRDSFYRQQRWAQNS